MKKAVVIGGGPSGFAAARALLAEHAFQVTILDAQSGPGGVWLYSGKSPMYENLNTNIPVMLMEFAGKPFDGDPFRFADRSEVYQYVAQYAKEIEPKITVNYSTEVTEVAKIGDEWLILDTKGRTYLSDFVVVATGHYTYPHIPPAFTDAPSGVIHSKHYQTPQPFTNQKLLIVGNGPSAVDIGVQLLSTVKLPLYIARQRVSAQDQLFQPEYAAFRPAVVSITEKSNKTQVTFDDGNAEEFDVVLLATGYTYDFPFLAAWDANNKEDSRILHPKRLRLCNLYKKIFYSSDPSLAFVGMESRIVPMPYVEHQAAAIARVWNRRLILPSLSEIKKEEDEELKKTDDAHFHVLGYPSDCEYMAQLWDWVDSATPGGFVAERWSDEKVCTRRDIAKLKDPEFRTKIASALASRQG